MARTWVLVAAILGSAMGFVDATAVNVTLPVLQHDLHASAGRVQWVVEGFALFLSALLLVGGALGDVVGRRTVFVWGVGLFALASLGCAFAPTIDVLIASRCVQGIGAAFMTPQSLALVSAAYTGDERGKAIGLWSGFAAIAGAAGPVIGGALAQAASWRWVFLINAPVAVAVVLIALLHVEDSRDDHAARRIDVRGALLATLALAGIVFGLIRLEAHRTSATGYAALAAGLVLGVAFVWWERRAPDPMLPWSIWSSRPFTVANLYTLLLYAALGGALYFLPFVLIDVHGYAPSAAGAALLPFIVCQFVFSRWTGALVPRFGARLPLVAGAAIAGLAFALFALPGGGGSYWTTFFAPALVLGIGGALFVAPLTTTVFDAAPPEHGGLASGVNNAVARTAGLLAIALFGIALFAAFDVAVERRIAHASLAPSTASVVREQRETLAGGTVPPGVDAKDRGTVEAAIRDGLVAGFRTVMLLSALVCFASALLAFVGLPARVPRSGHTAPAESAA